MITVTQQTRNYVLAGDLELGQFDKENIMKILSVINHDNITMITLTMITLTMITLTMITLTMMTLT
jgi:hypothetical protein